MTPDDPRHGSTRGFHAGCRCIGCRQAIAHYEKLTKYRRHSGIVWAIPAIGTQRRIRALMRLGWTSADIAVEAGYAHRNHVLRILTGQKGKPCRYVERKTYRAIAEAYERMAMRPIELTPVRRRRRTMSERRGWLPPLAWDSIDDPDETPNLDTNPTTYRAADLLAEWDFLRRAGVSIHTAAGQIGVTVGAIEKAVERASKESAA